MTRYNYAIGDQVNVISGTGTLTSAGTAITGSGTNFDPETPAGTVIHAAGQTLVVASVTNDTSLTLVTAPTVGLSGASFTITAMVNVETLFNDQRFCPRSSFLPWVESVALGSGLSRAMGRPSAVWTWGFLSQAARNTLRTYCTGKSARVYIRTRKNDSSDAYVTYEAVMNWPDAEDRFAGRRLSFSIEFNDLIAL